MGSNVLLKSDNLREAEAITGSIKSEMDNCIVNVYDGTPPVDGNAALSGNTLLFQLCFTNASAAYNITFNSAAPAGVLQSTTGNSVRTPTTGGAVATGTATFFRINKSGDDNSTSASGTNYRIQGSVGTDPTFALMLASTSIASGQNIILNGMYLVVN